MTQFGTGHHRRWILHLGLALLAMSGRAEAARIAWRSDFEQAVREARKESKPILMTITATWCHYCHKMIRETLSDEQVARTVNGCFIPVLVDADRNPALVRWANVDGLPSTVIVSPQCRVVKRISGYQLAREYLDRLREFCTAERKAASKPAVTRFAVAASYANEGYCPVSMLAQRRLCPGSGDHVASYAGKTYALASAEHRRRFEADPQRYLPALGGRCAVRGDRTAGKPRWAAIYRGRLWYFADQQARQNFLASPGTYLSGANDE